MTLNAVIRCSSCDRISPKYGSKDGKCKQCMIIERALEYINIRLNDKDFYEWNKFMVQTLKKILRGKS